MSEAVPTTLVIHGDATDVHLLAECLLYTSIGHEDGEQEAGNGSTGQHTHNALEAEEDVYKRQAVR